jgi:peptidoglycan/xylan/chitin deacetylase (PgdA/CDA1 family)
MPIQLLEKQLGWISNFADFVSLDEIISIRDPDRWKVAITLDDGYQNNLSLAVPVFERFEVPVTWFVSTKFIESDELPWWDLVDFMLHEVQSTLKIETKDTEHIFDLSKTQDQTHFRLQCRNWFQKAPSEIANHVRAQIEDSVGEKLPQNAFGTRREVIEASQSSLLTLGGHTVSHPNLASLPASEARLEIREGKEKLETWTSQSIRWFAYPYGGREHWNDRTKQIIREEEFDGAVTTHRAYADQGADQFEVPRLTVPNNRSLWQAKAWILAMNTCRELYRLKQSWIDGVSVYTSQEDVGQ